MVANQTSLVRGEHLVDVLLNEGIQVQKVFSPEHGFRGKNDAGEKVKDNLIYKRDCQFILYMVKQNESQVKNF